MRPPPPRAHLQTLRLAGMSQALVEPRQRPALAALTCEARWGLRVDRALTERANRRLTTRWRQATRRQTAGLDDIAERQPRGLAQALRARLATCHWVRERHNVFSTGPTGLG